MKTFSYIISIIMFAILAFLFYDSGISARRDKYISDVILANKTSNSDETFVASMFALEDLAYKTETIGTINYNNDIIVDDQSINLNISIDIYQTMPLVFEDTLQYFFHGVLTNFETSNDFERLTLVSYYQTDISFERNYFNTNLTFSDFPMFSLNNTITSSELNLLDTVVFKYMDVELFEIVLNNSKDLPLAFVLNEFPNYPSDLNHFYNTFENILDVRAGGYKTPTEEQVLELNELGYNYQIFDDINQFNYLIYIYLGIYLVILGIYLYFVFIKKIIRRA